MKVIGLEDRMKMLEMIECKRIFVPLLPICIRLDGKCFHNFTRGLNRPYDKDLTDLMIETTKYLVNKTGAIIGYTQSDEISLILFSDDYRSQVFFNGRIQKIVSVLASMTTAFFNKNLSKYLPKKMDELPMFDCRAWQVPNKTEAINNLVWRELDASKNSVSMAAQYYFSHKELQNKSCNEMQEMLFRYKSINWNDYPSSFKRGTYVKRVKSVRKFTMDEIENLPEKHEARFNLDLTVERSDVIVCGLPPITKIKNRVEFIFYDAEIEIKDGE